MPDLFEAKLKKDLQGEAPLADPAPILHQRQWQSVSPEKGCVYSADADCRQLKRQEGKLPLLVLVGKIGAGRDSNL